MKSICRKRLSGLPAGGQFGHQAGGYLSTSFGLELAQAGLSFSREIEQDIFYKELIGTRRADFVLEGKVLVELEAVIQLDDVHIAQDLN